MDNRSPLYITSYTHRDQRMNTPEPLETVPHDVHDRDEGIHDREGTQSIRDHEEGICGRDGACGVHDHEGGIHDCDGGIHDRQRGIHHHDGWIYDDEDDHVLHDTATASLPSSHPAIPTPTPTKKPWRHQTLKPGPTLSQLSSATPDLDDTYEVLSTPKSRMQETRKYDSKNSRDSFSGNESGDIIETLTNPRSHKDKGDNKATLESGDTYEMLTNPRSRIHVTSDFDREDSRDTFGEHAIFENADSYEVLTNPRARWLKDATGRSEKGSIIDNATLESSLTNRRAQWLGYTTVKHTDKETQGAETGDFETSDTYEVLTSPKPHPLWMRGRIQLAQEVKGHTGPGSKEHKEVLRHVGRQQAEEDVYASVDQLEATYAELDPPPSAKSGADRERFGKLSTKSLWWTAHSESGLYATPERVASLPSLFRKKGEASGAEPEDEYMPMASLEVRWRPIPVRPDRQDTTSVRPDRQNAIPVGQDSQDAIPVGPDRLTKQQGI